MRAVVPEGGFAFDYLCYAAERTHAPAVFHAGVALALLAGVAPHTLGIFLGTRLFANWWVILISSSGEGKSSAIENGVSILGEVSENVPVTERPGSPEALDDMLEKQPRRVLCYSEFPEFLETTRSGQASPLRSKLSRLYDCQPVVNVYRSKKGQPVSPIKHPRVSLLGGSAPEPLAAYTTPVEWSGGFMGRFCFLHAARTRNFDSPRPDEETRARLVRHLRYIDQQKSATGDCLGLDDEAMPLWTAWRKETDRIAERLPHRVRGAASRAQHVALKAALLYEFDLGTRARQGRDIPWWISAAVLRPALALADLHMRSLRTIGDVITESPDMRNRAAVLRVCVSMADMGAPFDQVVRESRLTSWNAARFLESLQDEGTVVEFAGPKKETRYRLRKEGEPMTAITTSASGARSGGRGIGEA